MAGKTKIDGTEYAVKKGKSLIAGTSYDVKSGKTLVNGTSYTIPFHGEPFPLQIINGGFIRLHKRSGKLFLLRDVRPQERVHTVAVLRFKSSRSASGWAVRQSFYDFPPGGALFFQAGGLALVNKPGGFQGGRLIADFLQIAADRVGIDKIQKIHCSCFLSF